MGVHPPEQVPTAAALAGGDCCIENISMEGAQGDPPEQAAVPIEEDPVINVSKLQIKNDYSIIILIIIQ